MLKRLTKTRRVVYYYIMLYYAELSAFYAVKTHLKVKK
jgi:hypothetical protein